MPLRTGANRGDRPAASDHGLSLHRVPAHERKRVLIERRIPGAKFFGDSEAGIGGIHGPDRHHCCPHCKSWMFTRSEGMDWFVNVRPTMFDDHSWFEPFVETCTSTKFPWASTGAVYSFDEFPALEAYQGLIREYSQQISA